MSWKERDNLSVETYTKRVPTPVRIISSLVGLGLTALAVVASVQACERMSSRDKILGDSGQGAQLSKEDLRAIQGPNIGSFQRQPECIFGTILCE